MPRDSNWHGSINRRQVLGSAGAAVTFGVLGTGNVLADDRVERTYGYRPREPAHERAKKRRKGQRPEIEEINYYISRGRWERVETAKDARRRVSERVSHLDDNDLVTVGFRNQHDGEASEKRIVVDYTQVVVEDEKGNERVVDEPDVSYERVEEETPYRVTGVAEDDDARRERELEVEVRRVEEREDHSCTVNEDHYDYFWYDVPGGAIIDDYCSTCMPGWHSTYGYVITSAGHCFSEGESIYQGGDPYGQVEISKDSGYVDIAVIDEKNSRGWDYSLADDDGTYDEDIAGWMDWQVIEDMVDSTFDPMRRQGQQSGRCAGIVQGAYKSNGIRHFDTDAKSDGGDSGGPHFDFDGNGDAMVSGLHRGTNLSTGEARATYIDDLYDEVNLYF